MKKHYHVLINGENFDGPRRFDSFGYHAGYATKKIAEKVKSNLIGCGVSGNIDITPCSNPECAPIMKFDV